MPRRAASTGKPKRNGLRSRRAGEGEAAGRRAREGFGRGVGGEEHAEEGGVDGEAEEERVAEQAGQRGGGRAEVERLRGGGVCADGLNAATRGENFFGPGFRYGARHSAPKQALRPWYPPYPMGTIFFPITYPRLENSFHTRLLIE